MGQKVNPISLRLEKTNRHFDSCWYDDYNYTDLLSQDLKIRNYFKTVLDQIQYPEGRLSIENLPKKTNINLFYCNPLSSRRKKNIRFQLQNWKEKKRKDKGERLHRNKERIRFQPGIERKLFWKNSLTKLDCRFFGRDFNNTGFLGNPLSLKESSETLNNSQLKAYTLLNQDSPQRERELTSLIERKSDPFGVNPQQRKAQYCGAVLFADLFNPFHSTLKYRSGNLYNINKLFLEFVTHTPREGLFKREIGGTLVFERFFVRYLLCFFYCKFLQNKRYTKYNTLYAINSLCNSGEQKRENTEKKRRPVSASSHKHLPSGLYSGNQIYKSHLCFSLEKQYHTLFNLFFFRSLISKQGANLLVQEIIYYLERKVPFRRIKTLLLREVPQYTCIKGIRINCSGRVGGRSKKAQRSKTQSVKIGQTSLGVFSCKIDFFSKSAKTRFGLIGVKVWICYQ